MSNEVTIVQDKPAIGGKPVHSLLELWTIFVKMKGDMAPGTRTNYERFGRLFCSFVDGKPLSTATMMQWMLHLRERKHKTRLHTKTISAAATNDINARVRSFLRWLKLFKYTQEDLAEAIQLLPETAAKEAKTWTADEYAAIKSYCHGRAWCQVHLWLIVLAYRTGMSLVDCCHLRWRDVNLNENAPSFIDIYRIKTARLGQKALCQIPIIPFTDVHEWLLRLKKAEQLNYTRHDGITDYVHQDAPGLYACRFSSINQDFRNIYIRSGIDIKQGKTFRNFRNTFVSNLVNAGAQFALICKMTGHQNMKTLLLYLKADRHALQEQLHKAFAYSTDSSNANRNNTTTTSGATATATATTDIATIAEATTT